MNDIDSEIAKEIELSKYLEEWSRNRYSEWHDFYHEVSRYRQNGIYLLKGGTELMNLLNSIMGNLEDKFALPDEDSHLIPTQFASLAHVIRFLTWFKDYVDSFKPILDSNINNGVIDNYIISEIYNMVGEIDLMAERCIKIYGDGGMPRPYQKLREQLFNKDIDGFVDSINSVMIGVPYLTRKKKFDEGHFQTMIQILLVVLGFEPITEQVLSDGRIDMVVKLEQLTYIFEFKYTESNKSQAKRALKQIIDKKYADPYKLTSKEIIAVGVSFSGKTKCINGCVSEKLL